MKTTLKFALGLVMIGFGIYLSTLGTPPSSKAASGDITSEWTATEFVNVQTAGEGGPVLGPITIGVAKWHVSTKQDGAMIYEEEWSADAPDGNTREGREITFIETSGSPIVVFAGFIKEFNKARFASNWLYGVGKLNLGATNHTVKFFFTPKPVNEEVLTSTGRQNFKSIGNNISCKPDRGNADCLATTGAYGFSVYDLMGDGVNEYPSGFGAMIPTKWTVTGKLK